jgi:hypothetical protein
LRKKEFLFAALFLFVFIFGLGALKYSSNYIATDSDSLSKWLLLVVAAVFVFYNIAKFFQNKSDRYSAGIIGERVIGKELKKLSDDFAVFHGLSIKSIGDVDYIVVGPTGIFAVEVKSHRFVDKFMYEKFSGQAKREAIKLREYIFKKTGERLWVESILVFSRAKPNHSISNINGIYILQRDNLVNFIKYHIESRHTFNVDYIIEKLNE